jgi:hypothetical protein
LSSLDYRVVILFGKLEVGNLGMFISVSLITVPERVRTDLHHNFPKYWAWGQVLAADPSNPNYSGGRGQED